ncbi:GNAT family N-acetyltransferase [Myxococcota bacterium]|nr:GNAT family N-acetyltransferase [Myxococcota bacterium]
MVYSTRDIRFEPALPEDEPELRRVLRETAMDGTIRLAFAREPNFYEAAAVEGPTHEAIVARDPTGRVLGLCSRSTRSLWVDREPVQVGYLSALRLEEAYRGRRQMLQRGFDAVRALAQADPATTLHMTTIFEDNAPALRFLSANLEGFPRYRRVGTVRTFAMPTWRRQRVPQGLALRPGTEADLPELAALLQRSLRRYQLAPVWTEADLRDPARCRGLRPEDFSVVERDGGLVGCVALWDQTAYKQSIVVGYEGGLSTFRGLVNLAAPLLNVPRLPPPGATLRHATLSHLAAEDDDEQALSTALIAYAYNRALGAGYSWLTLGLGDGDPLGDEVRRQYGAVEVRAALFLVSWPEGHAAADAVAPRVPRLEIATL